MTTYTEPPRLGGVLKYELAAIVSRDEVTVAAGVGTARELATGTVLGRIAKGTVTAAKHSGAGTGTITGVALGGVAAEIGAYVLTCTGGTFSVAAPTFAGTGDGVLTRANPAFGAGVKIGTYQAVCIEPAGNGGTFLVFDPDGVPVGTAVVGTPFDGPVKFTIADGSADFAAGATFSLAVSAAVPNNGGVFSVVTPGGARLADLTVGTPYASSHINLTVNDGGTDWAVGDVIHVTVPAGSGKVTELSFAALDGTATVAGVLLGPVTAPVGGDAPGVALVRGPAAVGDAGLVYPAGATGDQKAAVDAALTALGIVVRHAA